MKLIIAGLMLFASAGTLAQSSTELSQPHSSDAKRQLQAQLAPISTLQANFQQQVMDAEGELIQELQGELALARPNKFYWQSDAPDELILVADGQSVYYYDPFVEQVTISSQSNASAQSPFLLLLDAEASAWAEYEVSAEGLSYQLEPLTGSAQQQSLQVNFRAQEEGDAELAELILDDGQGQVTRIELHDVTVNAALPYTTFRFEIPEHAVVDDQREQP
ncbi:outer membrane lipoprotein chaperone LolA [Pseudidiomarina insulisalsae]|uniref:Outer-membrane lipoprotein carrier protein n=1 Tax=Pseudidiomarina insulisalsae TaxID=575789 RepID=A0A432YH49_9GAMM|nr:outer membrane lipoprotein chaperone LolA [Pseudidiomarina insulisalsae]RUO60264.1 outer membrane lipoprotein carrier protein LolA [Pseudidiomarina insulisalsae]